MDKRRFLPVYLVSVVLLVLTLTPISTQQDVEDYDPWYDINDDGKIDIKDVAGVAIKFGTEGTPINKTGLLLELLERVEALENQSLPSGYIGPPAYDSGWVSISWGETTFTHNLSTTEVLVYMIGWSGWGEGVHQYLYGGETRRVEPITFQYGVYWCELNSVTIKVVRLPSDYLWEQVRVMMWKISQP